MERSSRAGCSSAWESRWRAQTRGDLTLSNGGQPELTDLQFFVGWFEETLPDGSRDHDVVLS
jgi:hypothetical protein